MHIWGRFAIIKIENEKNSKTVTALRNRLDLDITPRAEAVRAIGKLGSLASSTVPDLIKYVDRKANSQPNATGWHAIVSLGLIGPESRAAVPLLIEILEEQRTADLGHPPIRSVAIESLARIGKVDARVVPALEEAAKSDPDPLMKLLAIRTLRNVADGKPEKPELPNLRTWRDKDGDLTVKAAYVKLTQREVVLDTEDGETVTMAIASLSKPDVDYLTGTLKLSLPESAGTDLLAERDHVSLAGHRDFIRCVGFSHDGKFIVSGGMDETVRIWDAATGDLIRDIDVRQEVYHVKFSPNGKWVFSSGPNSGHGFLWDVKTGQQYRQVISSRARAKWVHFTPDSKMALVGLSRGTDVYSIAARRFSAPFPKHEKYTHEIQSSTAEKFVMMVNPERKFYVADWKKVRRGFKPEDAVELRIAGLPIDERRYLYRAQLSPDNRYVVGDTEEDKNLHLWDAATGDLVFSWKHEMNPTCVTFSDDSSMVAIAGDHKNHDRKGDIIIRDVETKKLLARFGNQIGEINSIDFSPDGNVLVVSTSDYKDSKVHLWNLERLMNRQK